MAYWVDDDGHSERGNDGDVREGVTGRVAESGEENRCGRRVERVEHGRMAGGVVVEAEEGRSQL